MPPALASARPHSLIGSTVKNGGSTSDEGAMEKITPNCGRMSVPEIGIRNSIRSKPEEDSRQSPLQQGGILSRPNSVDSSKHQQVGVSYSAMRTLGASSGSSSPSVTPHRNSPPAGSNSSVMNKTVAFKSQSSTPVEDGSIAKISNANANNSKASNNSFSSSGTHHSLLKIGPRLRAEGLMVPPASDAATLRRQVAALQLDLEAHIDNEQRLQSINQQLRERLELYMKQNHENVERAENELNTLHEDMEQTLELQRRLAQRASALEKDKKELEQALQKRLQQFEAERSALQSQISSLSEDLCAHADAQARADALQAELESTLTAKTKIEKEIQSYCAEAESLRKKAEDYSKDLFNLMAKEQKNQLVEKCSRKPLLRRIFRRFQDLIEDQCVMNAYERAAIEFAKATCCKRGFLALQLATVRARHIRKAFSRQAKACLKEIWQAWHLATLAHRKFQGALQNRQRLCICKSIAQWKSLIEMGKLSDEEEQRLTGLAKIFWSTCICKRALKHWVEWIKHWARPKKMKLKDVQVHLDRLIARQAFAAWKCFIRVLRVRGLKLEEADLKGKLLHQKRYFSRWQEGVLVLRYERLLMEKALQFRKFCICRAVIKYWGNFLQIKRHRQVSKALAFRHYLRCLESKILSVWRHNVKSQQAKMRAMVEVNQALVRAAMVFWRDHHLLYTIKKKKENKAEVHMKRKAQKVAKVLLILWWEEMAWKRRALQLERLLASRRRRTLLMISLQCWMHSTFDNLLVANAKFHNELLEAKALYEDQKHQTTAVDVENLQLIDRLHTMSSEIAYLKMTITEKEKQEEDLHRALEDGAFIESSMRGELEQHHIRTEELELEILTLQKKLQMRNAEDTAGEIHHTLEIQNLEQAVRDLRIQLAEKTSQLDSYEKALKDTAEKLEGASDESQEKLSSAFEIASSLRKLLEDRESQYATLEGNCRRKELELGEVQRKLAVANNTFSETMEARDSRIHELEGLLAQKQAEVHDTQQELQDLQLALDAKETLVRKLEYEIKLKSEQESHRAKNFVSSLSTWPVGQYDASTGLRSNVHSIQMKESMRHVYTEAKAALQQAGSSDGTTGPRSSGNKSQAKATVHWETNSIPDQEGNDFQIQQKEEEQESPKAFKVVPVQDSCPSAALEKAATILASHTDVISERQGLLGSCLHTVDLPTQYCGQSDCETSFSLFSASRPSPAIEITEPYSLNELNLDQSNEGAALSSVDGPIHTVTECPGAVDSLHVEIQRLQARIMSRLRDSPHCEEKSRGTRLPQRVSPISFKVHCSDSR